MHHHMDDKWSELFPRACINIWTSDAVDQANIIFLEMQPVSSTAPFVHYLVLCLLLSGDYLVNRQLFVC